MKLRFAIGVAAALACPLVVTAQDSTPAAGSSVSPRTSPPIIEIGDLIARFAKRTGKQFVVDPRVRAEVPLIGMDPDRIGYERLLAILTVNYFAAVTEGDWIVVVPDANARQLPTPVFTDRTFKSGAPDEIVTLLVTPKNVCAANIVPVLRPLMPQAAHMAAYPDTNTLILSDHASNLHRIVTVVEALERAGEKNAQSVAECANQFSSRSSVK
jgi:general secretion pathway protein D